MKQCLYCNKLITKKENKFCNSSCATTFNNYARSNKITKPCLNCKKDTKNIKFCCCQCAAEFLHNKKEKYCLSCNKVISIGWCPRKYCNDCRYTNNHPNYREWNTVTLKDYFGGRPKYQANARIRALARDWYKKSSKPKCCCNCGFDDFYEVCHIKALKDFNRDSFITDVNHIDNLIALCPNCHWKFDNGKLSINEINT